MKKWTRETVLRDLREQNKESIVFDPYKERIIIIKGNDKRIKKIPQRNFNKGINKRMG